MLGRTVLSRALDLSCSGVGITSYAARAAAELAQCHRGVDYSRGACACVLLCCRVVDPWMSGISAIMAG